MTWYDRDNKGVTGVKDQREERIVNSFVRFFIRLFLCKLLRDHKWTCAAEQNLPPTKEQLAGGVNGFMDYAKMYCTRCGRIYHG